MKFFGFYLFFLCLSAFANENFFLSKIQDTTIQQHRPQDTTTISKQSVVVADSVSKKNVNTDTIAPKIYKKRIMVPSKVDSLLQDSLMVDSLLKLQVEENRFVEILDTAILLTRMTIYQFIPFYIVPQDLAQHTDRYEGEKRTQNNGNYNVYIYGYILLFLLAICINIFQAMSGKKYNKNTTLKSDIRKFAKLNNSFHLILLIIEFLLSIGFAVFLNFAAQIFYNQSQNFDEIKNIIFKTTAICFLFLIAKHIVTYIVQNIFLSKQDRFILLYFYKNMLIHLCSLLYIATCIVFLVDNPLYKIYIIKISIVIAILIYVYALFNILRNFSRILLSTFVGSLIYIMTIEILPYLLFFKFLYTHLFFIPQ